MEKSLYQNILVINFGQVRDVIMSLTAMRANRDRFPGGYLPIGKRVHLVQSVLVGEIPVEDVLEDVLEAARKLL